MSNATAISTIFNTVPKPIFKRKGIQLSITKQLIKNEAKPTLILACKATPCDKIVQGAEPKFDSSKKPSPMPNNTKDRHNGSKLRNFNSHSWFALHLVLGNT